MSETDGVCISRLITLVRERPVLWDRQEEVYKNRKLTKKAWAEICEALLDNYKELADEDQKAFGRSVIGKWANLRDNWLRYWRKRQDHIRSGLCISRFKKYIHHEQLMFLSKVYDQSESDMQQEVEEIQVEVDVLSDPGTESPLGISSDEVSQTPWNYGLSSEDASQTPWNLPPERENPVQESIPSLPPLAEERHLYFFQSTLPMIADFDENQVLEFHSAVLESIKRIKSGKNLVNIMTTPQPAYILAIAQPQGFLTNTTELKPKALTIPNTAKQCSEPVEQPNHTKVTEDSFSLSVSSTGTQITTSPKHNHGEVKLEQAVNSPAIKSTIPGLELSDLKSVVNKLDELSKKFEISPFEDSYDKFGKYIGSFLRTISHKKAQILKRRIVRQVLRVQLADKLNSNKLHKPVERCNQNDSFLVNSARSDEDDFTNKTPVSNTKVANSILGNAFQNAKLSKTCVVESTNNIIPITNNKKPNGNPFDNCPTSPDSHLFTCHVCAFVCVSSADLRSHLASQHKGYTDSLKKSEPAKRGRPRGRKRKNFNYTEVIT